MVGTCKHCGTTRKMANRGLCRVCYRDKAVRIQYAPLPGGERSGLERDRVRCIGCDRLPPAKRLGARSDGWVSVRVVLSGGIPLRELHCPACVAEYGISPPIPWLTPERVAELDRAYRPIRRVFRAGAGGLGGGPRDFQVLAAT